MKHFFLTGLLSCVFLSASADTIKQVSSEEDTVYTVVKGDTLWDIAGRFLEKPWRWPRLWNFNPDIKDPHRIYPGDKVQLVYKDGQPALHVSRPTAPKETGATNAITLIPLVPVRPPTQQDKPAALATFSEFFVSDRILDKLDNWDKAPRILANDKDSPFSSAGSTVYARGQLTPGAQEYEVFREGQELRDPENGQRLGLWIRYLGKVRLDEVSHTVSRLTVTQSGEALRAGDRLLVPEKPVPSAARNNRQKDTQEGIVLASATHSVNISPLDTVLVNLGARDQAREGDTLEVVRHKTFGGQSPHPTGTLSRASAGQVMLYRVFEHASLALVLEAHNPLVTGDKLVSP